MSKPALKDYIKYVDEHMTNEDNIKDRMQEWTLQEFQIYFGHTTNIITNEGHAPLQKVTIELYLKDSDQEACPLDRLTEYDIRVEVNDEGTEYTGFQIQHHESEEYVTEFVSFKEDNS